MKRLSVILLVILCMTCVLSAPVLALDNSSVDASSNDTSSSYVRTDFNTEPMEVSSETKTHIALQSVFSILNIGLVICIIILIILRSKQKRELEEKTAKMQFIYKQEVTQNNTTDNFKQSLHFLLIGCIFCFAACPISLILFTVFGILVALASLTIGIVGAVYMFLAKQNFTLATFAMILAYIILFIININWVAIAIALISI